MLIIIDDTFTYGTFWFAFAIVLKLHLVELVSPLETVPSAGGGVFRAAGARSYDECNKMADVFDMS